MPQLRGLDGGIPPTIVFGQRVVQALHHPFDSRCMRVHAALLPLVALQSKDLISYSLKIRKLFASRSLFQMIWPFALGSSDSFFKKSPRLTTATQFARVYTPHIWGSEQAAFAGRSNNAIRGNRDSSPTSRRRVLGSQSGSSRCQRHRPA